MTWTREQLDAEWLYLYTERLGILCGDSFPSEEIQKLAREDADRHIAALASNDPP